MNNVMLSLVATECREAARSADTLDDRIKAAFKAARNHWMVRDENEQFQGAVAGIYELSDETDRERIKMEMDGLRALSALFSGVPVDMSQIPIPEKPIGLLKTWKETTR